ncbi:Hypothetical predicted protein [Mytilus galloprovincialis]|uniref:RING-type domain-containing protein n=1 Tax=Mytilus galloprovincialis TaxID=29158 RepID=A0A8B6G9P3_MYTGA|nr:Hypothetical predicted protein [Mytilus galloprovincialis]
MRQCCKFEEGCIVSVFGLSNHSFMQADKDSVTELPLKVFNWNRRVRKLIGVKSFPDMLNKCRERFSHEENANLRFVLAEDGVEIDQDSFHFLSANTSIMLLKDDEDWVLSSTATQSVPGSSGSSSRSLNEDINAETRTTNEMLGYIESLKEKCTRKRKGQNALGSAPAPKQQIPDTLRVSPGWRHFSYSKNQYTQVRSRKGMTLPTGDMILQTNIDYETCLHTLENLFFPNGKSVKGRISTMETKLGNFHGEVLPGNFFLHQAVARSGSSQKSKLYLLSKKKIPQLFVETESSSESENEQLVNRPVFVQDNPQNRGHSPQQFTSLVPSFGYLTPVAATSTYQQHPTASSSPFTEPATASTSSYEPPAAPSASFTSPPAANSGSFVVHAGTPTVQMQLPNALKRCVVCADREVDTVLMPCVHTLCFLCAQHLFVNNERCPMCRGPITDVKEIQYGA